MDKPEITREQIIIVDEVGANSYGDLTFTDKEGIAYKVSNKRKKYFEDVIVPDMAVQLNYAEAYNKEYIYSASQVKDKLPPPKKPQVSSEMEKAGKIPPAETPKLSAEEIKLRSMAISYSKDLACAKLIGVADMKRYANEFLHYMKGEAIN